VAEYVGMLTSFDSVDGSSYRNSNRQEQARMHTHRVFVLDSNSPRLTAKTISRWLATQQEPPDL
jgi:hypothetical protein